MTAVLEDRLLAALDLVGRSGAANIEFGYLHDGVPVADADWWATATYRGAKLTVEHHRGPAEAVDALARKVLRGGQCTGCGQTVSLYSARAGCHWYRRGASWVRSCDGKAKATRRR